MKNATKVIPTTNPTGRAYMLAFATALSVSSFAGGAQAQSRCEPVEGGSHALADVDADARLSFVRQTMHAQAAYAKKWTWAWSGIGFALAAGQYGLMALVPAHERFEEAFQGTATLYLPASLVVFPLRVRADDVVLESFLAQTEVNGHGMAPCVRLARAEELLMSSAEDESLHTNWLQHTLTIVLSGAYAAILGVAFKNVGNVILNGVSALVLGETQLLTAPTGAVSALERYRKGDLTLPQASQPSVSWSLAPLSVGTGIALVARF